MDPGSRLDRAHSISAASPLSTSPWAGLVLVEKGTTPPTMALRPVFESDNVYMVSAHHDHVALGVSARSVEADVDDSFFPESDVNTFPVLVGLLPGGAFWSSSASAWHGGFNPSLSGGLASCAAGRRVLVSNCRAPGRSRDLGICIAVLRRRRRAYSRSGGSGSYGTTRKISFHSLSAVWICSSGMLGSRRTRRFLFLRLRVRPLASVFL